MVGPGNIHLLKQLSTGQKFEFTGSLEEFLLNCPDNLKTIDIEDICVIKISEEITPDQVQENLNGWLLEEKLKNWENIKEIGLKFSQACTNAKRNFVPYLREASTYQSTFRLPNYRRRR